MDLTAGLEAMEDRNICATGKNRTWIPVSLTPHPSYSEIFELYRNHILAKIQYFTVISGYTECQI
jgi:hypothetical protein